MEYDDAEGSQGVSMMHCLWETIFLAARLPSDDFVARPGAIR